MVVRSLKVEKYPFLPRKEDEDALGSEVPYLSVIGDFMYLANNTRPDIAFVMKLLARFILDPTKRNWDGIKHIFEYLRGTVDLGLILSNSSTSQLVGYADAGYYGIVISWKSMK
ncbi:secreted RxLR effector protein 161-like [Apium graveolens]|uniref:secreted RxLR effector protein 161-like n=1 Tax=Apium graveolens TaxID=4045 RepID=UPI003D791111